MVITSTTAGVTDGSTTKNTSIALTFTASEATTTFVAGDIIVTNGTISSFTAASSIVYNATFTPLNAGDCTIDVPVGTFTDAAGNNNTAATTFNWEFDNIKPAMTITSTTAGIISGSTTNNLNINLTFTTSKPTTNFATGDITVSNGSISNFAALSSTVYTAIFTPTANGACTIDVAANTFTDAANNDNTAATQFNWTQDTVEPSMVITSTTAGVTDGSSTTNTSIALTFTASEATTTFIAADIIVTNGTISLFTAVSSTVYTATFTPATNGPCTINVAKNKFTDAAGNDNIAAPTFNWTKQ